MSFVAFVSKRYLKPERDFSFAFIATINSVLGIAVCVVTLIVIVSILVGFEFELKSRIVKAEPHIILTGRDGNRVLNHDSLSEQLVAIPGIDQVTSFINFQSIISSNDAAVGTIIKGIQSFDVSAYNSCFNSIFFENRNFEEAPAIFLSMNLMEILGLLPGDFVYVASMTGLFTPLGCIPSIKRFEVVGSTEFESNFTNAYILLSEAQKLLKQKDGVTGIEIKVDLEKNIDVLMNSIKSKISSSLLMKTWKENNENLFFAMKLEKTVMLIILLFVVIIATLGIMASLTITVLNKRREISILKIMGAQNKDINKIFLLKGITMGLLGIIPGSLLGVILSIAIANYPPIKMLAGFNDISTLPICIRISDVMLIVLFTLLLSILVSVFPAKKATNSNLLLALNYKK